MPKRRRSLREENVTCSPFVNELTKFSIWDAVARCTLRRHDGSVTSSFGKIFHGVVFARSTRYMRHASLSVLKIESSRYT